MIRCERCGGIGMHKLWCPKQPLTAAPDRPEPGDTDRQTAEALRDVLRVHHPVMRSETGPFSGCRCGQVKLGQDVIAHVVDRLRRALDGDR